MSTHNLPFSIKKNRKESHPELSIICRNGFYPRDAKFEFETAVVNEPSVFKPLKFYCILVQCICKLGFLV